MTIRRLTIAATLACSLPACLAPTDTSNDAPEEVARSSSPITNGTLVAYADPWWRMTVGLHAPNGAQYCTGTVIGPKHVLTAAHCTPLVNEQVRTYNGSSPSGFIHTITRVFIPQGVNPPSDLIDTAGKFADIAVVEVSTPMYVTGSALSAAKLPEDYIGNGQSSNGVFVGVGTINGGQANPGDKMRWAPSKVYSSSNADGHMLIDSSDNDPGDSGGPFFTNTALGWTVHGALYGIAWEWAWHGKYTSISFHLNRVMSAIGASQRSACAHSSTADLALFDTSLNQCKIQCVQNASCKAWDFTQTGIVGGKRFGHCSHKSSVGSNVPFGATFCGEPSVATCTTGPYPGSCLM